MSLATMAAVQDRTQEFRSCVSSLSKTSGAKRGTGSSTAVQERTSARSEFMMRASTIATEISETTSMLQRLAVLAKRKTLFDDRPVEINELTQVIKQKVSRINDSIAGLQQSLNASKNAAWGKKDNQVNEHSKNVVILLQEKLTDVTTGFTEVLETRTKNIQASRSRTEQFLASASQATVAANSPLYSSSPRPASAMESYGENPYSGALQEKNPYASDEYLALPEQQQSMALLEEQDQYLSSRSNAVEAIESTIQELGSIFSQLATMVAEQRETVQRIDANTEDISLNVSGAQRELLKYYARISSNRWLMVKIFGILIFFFFIWVLVS
ncbi:integral membrane protein Sed5p [Trichomonascus vanleenenianus]|uniref:t-SNARE syntaxin n=1 Tax=Trichomonascus vanleenenianus TaxID=2268995 RepID=UPI003ECAD998